jgi:predicted transcriptional regulator
MAGTTTLKLPDTLKRRIAPLAEAAGKTPHAWMVEALEAQVELADLRRAFVEDAKAAAAEVDAGGPLYAMEDVAAYVRARVAGKAAARPAPIGEARETRGGGKARVRAGRRTSSTAGRR